MRKTIIDVALSFIGLALPAVRVPYRPGE